MRHAVRAIIVRPHAEAEEAAVLLARSHDRFDASRSWWELPGGGIEPGEDHEQALRRELREETGYVDVAIGRRVCEWTTQWVFADREVDQHDIVHAVRLRSSERVEPAPLESEGLAEVVWVPLRLIDDLRAPVVPVQLAQLIADLDQDRASVELLMPARVPWPLANGAQVVVRLWAHPGRYEGLRAAEDALLNLALDHGGFVTSRVRPLAHGDDPDAHPHDTSDLPDEVHVLRFDGPLELEAYLLDPRRAALDLGAIARTEVTPVASVPTTRS